MMLNVLVVSQSVYYHLLLDAHCEVELVSPCSFDLPPSVCIHESFSQVSEKRECNVSLCIAVRHAEYR